MVKLGKRVYARGDVDGAGERSVAPRSAAHQPREGQREQQGRGERRQRVADQQVQRVIVRAARVDGQRAERKGTQAGEDRPDPGSPLTWATTLNRLFSMLSIAKLVLFACDSEETYSSPRSTFILSRTVRLRTPYLEHSSTR